VSTPPPLSAAYFSWHAAQRRSRTSPTVIAARPGWRRPRGRTRPTCSSSWRAGPGGRDDAVVHLSLTVRSW